MSAMARAARWLLRKAETEVVLLLLVIAGDTEKEER